MSRQKIVDELKVENERLKRAANAIVTGARCLWWDSITKASTLANGLPCCPHCRSVLFEFSDEKAFFKGADQFEADGHPGYVAILRWIRGRCFPTYEAARQAFEASR